METKHSNPCDPSILATAKDCCIAKCGRCGGYSLVFKNVVVHFNCENYRRFKQFIECMKPEDYMQPIGEAHKMLLETYDKRISLLIDCDELYTLRNMMAKAQLRENINSNPLN